GQQAIADHHRAIDFDRTPIAFPGRRKLHLARQVREPRDAAGRLAGIVVSLGLVGRLWAVVLLRLDRGRAEQKSANAGGDQQLTRKAEAGHGNPRGETGRVWLASVRRPSSDALISTQPR